MARRPVLPLARRLATWTGPTRRADVVAGLTVGALIVPQAMAYAALAGMPPVTGLYASTVPLITYALLGTSGQLAFGPVAIVSLLTASTLAEVADGDPGAYVAAAAVLALLVGAIQLVLGLARAGRLTTLLSVPVVSGFTSAAAIVIATTQLDPLLGISTSGAGSWPARFAAIVAGVGGAHGPTLLAGSAAVVALEALRRFGRRVPGALIIVVVATALVPLAGITSLAVIGDVPAGLPAPRWPSTPLATVGALLPGAVVIALLSYLESLSVARAVALRTRERIDADQELIASAAANVAAGLFQSFPVAGGFSRTAVNHAAGARTPVAGLVSAGVVVLTLLAVAPLLRTLPQVVLAAIVIVSVVRLVDVREAVHAWRVERTDGLALVITFVATLVLGVEIGISVGVGVSLVLSLWRVGVPHVRIDHDGDRVTVRVEGDLLPASGARLVEAIDRALADLGDGAHLRLLLDLSGVPSADVSGVQALAAIDAACASSGVELHLVGLRQPVLATVRRAGLDRRLAGRVEALATG